MDFKTPRYFHQSHPNFSSLVNGESALEMERDNNNNNNNPFAAETFPDPLCKLNLKETSEFVKSFPRRENSAAQKRLVVEPAPPPTPGRPVFGFSPSGSSGNGLHRKSFPSKWDDAEKWLVNCSSCHDSPAHHHNAIIKPSDHSLARLSNNKNNINNNVDNVFEQQIMEVLSEKSRVIEENKVASKAVPNFHHHNNSSVRGFNGVLGSTNDLLLLKDKFTDETQLATTIEPTKEAFVFKNPSSVAMAMRDAATEMTPLGSSTTSRCPTPASPARHNTPLDRSGPLGPPPCTHVDVARLAKLQLYDSVASNWTSREEEEEEISKSLRHFEIIDNNNNGNNGCHNNNNTFITNNNVNSDSRVVARWEEDEKAKCCSRYQREEAKIQAWVNLQNAKAEAQSRKLEVKIQKMRSNLEEKLMKRMTVVHRKADELRECAKKQHSDQMEKATQHSHNNNNKKLNCNNIVNYSHFSTYATASCGCFPCNNSTHYI